MTVEFFEEVTTLIIRTVQRDMYAKEISHLEQGRIMAGTTFGSLDPYLDDKNIYVLVEKLGTTVLK